MSMEGEGENSVSKIGSLELLSTIGFEGKLQWSIIAGNLAEKFDLPSLFQGFPLFIS